MAMSVGGDSDSGDPMMDINTTPLIDVMLVLLIMFIITIPIQTHAVKLDLPPPVAIPSDVKPDFNTVKIDFLNAIYWNDSQVTLPQLDEKLRSAAVVNGSDPAKQPELRLTPDALTKYEVVDQVMAAAQKDGITKMGFVGNEKYAN